MAPIAAMIPTQGTPSLQSTTSEAGGILVNAVTFEGWYLLLGQAVAISCTTAIPALLLGGLSRREGARGEIEIARIECFRAE